MPLSAQAAFRRIVWAALIAGLIAGVLTTGLQQVTTIPLITQAEAYERGTSTVSVNENTAPTAGAAPSLAPTDHHDNQPHEHAIWEPAEGLERTAFTGVATTLAAFGYALLLGAALTQLRKSGLGAGLALGAAGFLVFQLAPALGLPPEPPGVPMSDLLPRQTWWMGTVLATALALACWLRARSHSKPFWMPVGVILILLPHVIGPPLPPDVPAVVPEGLVRKFSLVAIAVAAAFWLVLGAAVGLLLKQHKTDGPQPMAQTRALP